MSYSGNALLVQATSLLGSVLPPLWTASLVHGPQPTMTVTTPSGNQPQWWLHARQHLYPKQALEESFLRSATARPIVVAPFLSRETQERLKSVDVDYIDLTGNVSLNHIDPDLFVSRTGATRAPTPELREQSLKGEKAASVLLELLHRALPAGVREIAARSKATPGYVSKLLAALDERALLSRNDKGQVTQVDRWRLLQAWATDSPVMKRCQAYSCIEPRGLPSLLSKLPKLNQRWAITGSLAAQTKAPVAPPRLAMIYVEQIAEAATVLGLQPADTGYNVLLLSAPTSLPFDRAWTHQGLQYADLYLVIVDLLTSPGRSPAEAEALWNWIQQGDGSARG